MSTSGFPHLEQNFAVHFDGGGIALHIEQIYLQDDSPAIAVLLSFISTH